MLDSGCAFQSSLKAMAYKVVWRMCSNSLPPPPSPSDPRDLVTRSLRGVMRVGLVAKGLLLKGDLHLELVLLCKDKPTARLLGKVADNLTTQLRV